MRVKYICYYPYPYSCEYKDGESCLFAKKSKNFVVFCPYLLKKWEM